MFILLGCHPTFINRVPNHFLGGEDIHHPDYDHVSVSDGESLDVPVANGATFDHFVPQQKEDLTV